MGAGSNFEALDDDFAGVLSVFEFPSSKEATILFESFWHIAKKTAFRLEGIKYPKKLFTKAAFRQFFQNHCPDCTSGVLEKLCVARHVEPYKEMVTKLVNLYESETCVYATPVKAFDATSKEVGDLISSAGESDDEVLEIYSKKDESEYLNFARNAQNCDEKDLNAGVPATIENSAAPLKVSWFDMDSDGDEEPNAKKFKGDAFIEALTRQFAKTEVSDFVIVPAGFADAFPSLFNVVQNACAFRKINLRIDPNRTISAKEILGHAVWSASPEVAQDLLNKVSDKNVKTAIVDSCLLFSYITNLVERKGTKENTAELYAQRTIVSLYQQRKFGNDLQSIKYALRGKEDIRDKLVMDLISMTPSNGDIAEWIVNVFDQMIVHCVKPPSSSKLDRDTTKNFEKILDSYTVGTAGKVNRLFHKTMKSVLKKEFSKKSKQKNFILKPEHYDKHEAIVKPKIKTKDGIVLEEDKLACKAINLALQCLESSYPDRDASNLKIYGDVVRKQISIFHSRTSEIETKFRNRKRVVHSYLISDVLPRREPLENDEQDNSAASAREWDIAIDECFAKGLILSLVSKYTTDFGYVGLTNIVNLPFSS